MSRRNYVLCVFLSLLAILPLVPYIRFHSRDVMSSSCIFCDITAGKKPDTKIEVETKEFIIFKDIKPASKHHYLAVTKRHIESLKTLTKEDDALVVRMEAGLKEFFASKGIDSNDALFGFHLPPYISVKHLHMHAIAPRSTMSFINRMMFRPKSAWFKTVEDARKYLQEKTS